MARDVGACLHRRSLLRAAPQATQRLRIQSITTEYVLNADGVVR
jgi:hypothetical protein